MSEVRVLSGQLNLDTMEDTEFDAAIKDIDETIAVMTQVIDNIKALEHEKDPQQLPIF